MFGGDDTYGDEDGRAGGRAGVQQILIQSRAEPSRAAVLIMNINIETAFSPLVYCMLFSKLWAADFHLISY